MLVPLKQSSIQREFGPLAILVSLVRFTVRIQFCSEMWLRIRSPRHSLQIHYSAQVRRWRGLER